MIDIRITFEDKDFKKLENAKEELKILGKVKGWRDFILLKCLNLQSSKGGKKK